MERFCSLRRLDCPTDLICWNCIQVRLRGFHRRQKTAKISSLTAMESASHRLPKWTAYDSYFSGRGPSFLPCALVQSKYNIALSACSVLVCLPRRGRRRVGCDRKQFSGPIGPFPGRDLGIPARSAETVSAVCPSRRRLRTRKFPSHLARSPRRPLSLCSSLLLDNRTIGWKRKRGQACTASRTNSSDQTADADAWVAEYKSLRINGDRCWTDGLHPELS